MKTNILIITWINRVGIVFFYFPFVKVVINYFVMRILHGESVLPAYI